MEIPLDIFRNPVLTGLDPSLAFHDQEIIVEMEPHAAGRVKMPLRSIRPEGSQSHVPYVMPLAGRYPKSKTPDLREDEFLVWSQVLFLPMLQGTRLMSSEKVPGTSSRACQITLDVVPGTFLFDTPSIPSPDTLPAATRMRAELLGRGTRFRP